MPTERARRNKESGRFDIVIIPAGEGGASRSLSFSKRKLWFVIAGSLFAVFFISLAGLIYTPLALIIPLPNSVLEEKYGRQLLATQMELRALGQEVIRLGEYNRHLRTILGVGRADSAAAMYDPADFVVTEQDASVPTDLMLEPYVSEYVPQAGSYSPVSVVVDAGPSGMVRLPFVSPVTGIVSQRFEADKGHFGIDFASKLGTPVFASASGSVIFSGWTHDGGNMVMITHGSGYVTVYKHNQTLLVAPHVNVERGAVIALLGSSGSSTGPHLHFEIWKDGNPVDPEELLLESIAG
ncbi:MAG: M23 family metallopeptidase [Ignavibacteria bacterium]|nr:M23 family metallopeptidase [Ignavibacteria bacterium]